MPTNPTPTPTPAQPGAVEEFKAIRNALLVPFVQDLRDLHLTELPPERRWRGPCLGYVLPHDPGPVLAASSGQAEKSKTETKT